MTLETASFLAPPPASLVGPASAAAPPTAVLAAIFARPGQSTEARRSELLRQTGVALTIETPQAADDSQADAIWSRLLDRAAAAPAPPAFALRLPLGLRLNHDGALAAMLTEAQRRPGDVWIFCAQDWASQAPTPTLRLERVRPPVERAATGRTILPPARLGLPCAWAVEPTALECWRRGRDWAAEIQPIAAAPRRRAQAGALLLQVWASWRRLGDPRRLHLLLGAQSLLAAGRDAGGTPQDPALEALFMSEIQPIPETRLAAALAPVWDDPIRVMAQILSDGALGV